MASPLEEQRNREDSPETKEMLHKTKLIQFLGRNTPIILQNDNGPCPLLAICNVLLLRNNMNLSSDVGEVSQEKLLSLVAERLIDSNSNVNNKDAGYVENQQQNIADAIDLLPRLTTGIDVNLKFTRIDDFEFTRECAIFDLLDIPLYHGWIVDPQDFDTASAIGLKSYNTIMGELVALETQNVANDINNPEEDCVDFVAATTASLGVPSPSLSRVKSFDDSPHSVSDEKKERKGDLQEEEELLKALQLSVTNSPTTIESKTDSDLKTPESVIPEKVHTGAEHENEKALKLSETESLTTAVNDIDSDPKKLESVIPEELHTGENNEPCIQKPSTDNDNNGMNKSNDDLTFETVPCQEACSSSQGDNDKIHNTGDQKIHDESVKGNDVNVEGNAESVGGTLDDMSSCLSAPIPGEEHIQETSTTANYENGEPMYEGEVVLAEQVDKGKDGITPKQGELIRNFLKNSASQLTIYGLFSLQEGLKERELCVFFRNNHFNTMFKFEGELYLLATDQGYISQPDLVWEKLNEVNGDSVFMTGNFKEFNAESQESHSWDEQNALANTADYLASIDNSPQENTGFNSDLQLAIALQQQEFEQQQQQQQPPSPQPPRNDTAGESGFITGPQHVQPSRPKSSSSSSSSKQESKSSKEKCTVM
ncbi:unnamed protein product [Lactuca saligna]|uniref:MINDY deubiquitinase domain-containing protein n=1 Tax=Lactuca saligna TaxID=75948 RepID=A0AA35ZAG9_LACSI|nr:unnamed protein product [Lactuca saligna]